MIKHTVTYFDFDEVEQTRDFWFNLNEGDVAEIQMSRKQGFFEVLQVAVDNEDPTIVAEAFQKIIVRGVGRREGELFIKDDAARNQLVFTNAYGALIVWMLANPIEAQALVNGMLPKRAQDAIENSKDELVEKMKAKVAEMAVPETPQIEEVPVHPQTVEAIEEAAAAPLLAADFSSMSPEEFEAWKTAQTS